MLRDKDLPGWLSLKTLKAEGPGNADMESTHSGFPSPDVEEGPLETLMNEWKWGARGLHTLTEAS